MQLQDASDQFQLQLSADGRSEHTRKQYARHVRAFIEWLKRAGHHTTVARTSPVLVAAFFSSDDARLSARGGPKKATSANSQRTSLRCFFRWAHESGLTSTNPARLLRRARCSPPPPRALHADEQKRLLDILADARGPEAKRDAMLVQLLLGCGVRIGSALGLDVEDVDFAHSELTLRLTKNDRPCSAVMPTGLAKRLKAFVGTRAEGPLFLAHDRRISMRHAQRRISTWFARASIEGRSAHSLRHTFATSMLARTGDLRLVQAAMNHSSIVSTTVYAAVDRARLRDAVGS